MELNTFWPISTAQSQLQDLLVQVARLTQLWDEKMQQFQQISLNNSF